ncbi:hypothetical protein H310_02196 [Aphanomyces invadans]|uniref:BAR domain-containing protein n=1 Tax=Aphanomyces invadans TaxID=157072 RepID=A0A024UN71_9STRA|nr:hypothetical protein H310_02196 [Aphanomyces invadans]ETW07754.1 hypothetical protein H310_02196 [Aphanomyces invadans]|eukprot:XP_008863847.1 hypothetical protein H310_02196 [Aphanomyces invadans]
MSSIRVRATNKLLTKIGATKPSKNVQFDQAFSGFEQLQSGIVNLDNAVKGYIAALRGFHTASTILNRAIEDVSNFKCTDIPSESPEVKQFIDVFKACSLNIDITHVTELAKAFETRVQTPAQGWTHQVNLLHKECADFNETHITYDHYNKKVLALREAHNKRVGAGKHEKGKEVDKLVRNEQKLVTITNEYNQAAETTIHHLRDFLRHRDSTLLPLVQRVIEFRIHYTSAMVAATKKMEPLLAITSYDEHLATLESFATNGHAAAATDKPAPRVSGTASHIATSDIQVNKLSFSDFVGPSTDSTSPSPPARATMESWGDFGDSPPSAASSPVPPPAVTSFGSNKSMHGGAFVSAPPQQPQSRTASGHVGLELRANSSNRIVNVLDFASPPLEATSNNPFGGGNVFMDFTMSDLQGHATTHGVDSPLAGGFNPFAPPPPAPASQTAPLHAAVHTPTAGSPGFDSFDLLGAAQ